MPDTETTKRISNTQVTLLSERLASTDSEIVADGIRRLRAFVNLGFEIPAEPTDLMISRLVEVTVDHLDDNDREMIKLLERLDIAIPAGPSDEKLREEFDNDRADELSEQVDANYPGLNG